jgi:hypothetical protein
MAFRVEASPRLNHLSAFAKYPLVSPILSFVCRKRAGIVWLAERDQ